MIKNSLCVCIWAFVYLASVMAQTSAPDEKRPGETEPQRIERHEREQKALALLDDVIVQASSLKRTDNLVRVQLAAANLFWSYDEKRARALYRSATNELAQMAHALESDGSSQRFNSFVSLRTALLQEIASRDATLALDSLRATRPSIVQNSESPTAFSLDWELQIESGLAEQIALNDPAQALATADEILSKGYPSKLLDVIKQLYGKDPEAAATLTNTIVVKLRRENFAVNQDAATFALQLIERGIEIQQTAQTKTTNQSAQSAAIISHPVASGTILIAPATIRELIEKALAAAQTLDAQTSVEANAENPIYASLRAMMPVVEKYAPANADSLQRRLIEENKSNYLLTRAFNDFDSASEKGDVDAMVNAIKRIDSNWREIYYQNLLSYLVNNGEEARALHIINTHADSSDRRFLLEHLDKLKLTKRVSEAKVEESRRMLMNLHNTQDRALALTQLALAVSAKDNKERALKLLDEADALIPAHSRNAAQLKAQIVIATAYADLKSPRGFEIIEQTVDRFNELLAAIIALDGFANFDHLTDDELPLDTDSLSTTLIGYKELIAALPTFARFDFERTRRIADRFQRPEIRLLARLTVAQGVLIPLTHPVTSTATASKDN